MTKTFLPFHFFGDNRDQGYHFQRRRYRHDRRAGFSTMFTLLYPGYVLGFICLLGF